MVTKEIRILFTEQNSAQQTGLKRFFEAKGVRTYFCAKDGKEVLKQIEQYSPQVVVIDAFLASIDAIEVRKYCEGKQNCPQLFFACGGYDNDKIAAQLINAGFDYFLVKPYAFEVLLDRVETLLGSDFSKKVQETTLNAG